MRTSALLVALCAGCTQEALLRSEAATASLPDLAPPPLLGRAHTDRISQLPPSRADVLFVVDNSSSMSDEQSTLAANFPRMLSWLQTSGVDWHLGVVATDMTDGAHRGRLVAGAGQRWLEPTTARVGETFASMVQLGTEGSGFEQGRAAAYTALETRSRGHNSGFLRDDASLHVIVVSDEDDTSGEAPIALQDFVAFLQDYRPRQRDVTFSSIVGPRLGCDSASSPGTEYQAVTEQVGGVFWPICLEPWSTVMEELGRLAVGLSSEFFLSQVPLVHTLQVQVIDGDAVTTTVPDDDYRYVGSRNSIVFTEIVPPAGAVVEVRYEVAASSP
ncbi:MAG: VWA domain-containing protein [Myxococcales bacterium]|nr:VWA domain-containing protein [Myxococcales bacterium]